MTVLLINNKAKNMPSAKPYTTDAVKEIIIKNFQDGKGIREISRIVDRNPSTISRILKRWGEEGSVATKKKTGRPKKTTSTDMRALTRLSKANPKMTARELQTSWAPGAAVSTRTVQRILFKYGLVGRVAANKPNLTERQRKNRLQWCKAARLALGANWRHIVFSDESKYELHPRRREYFRRPSGKENKYDPRYTTKTVKFGGGSVMAWGFVHQGGLRKITRIVGTLDAPKYTQILRKNSLLFLDENDVFQQDGAPCHTAAFTRRFFEEEGVALLADWPAQSPDLNIIEEVWNILKKKMEARIPRNVEELWKFVEEEFYAIPDEKIDDLYRGIIKRLEAVIKAKGFHTKY